MKKDALENESSNTDSSTNVELVSRVVAQQYQRCIESANRINSILAAPYKTSDDINDFNRARGFLKTMSAKIRTVNEEFDMSLIDTALLRSAIAVFNK